MNPNRIFIFAALFSASIASGQKLVLDTLVVPLRFPPLAAPLCRIDSVRDLRNVDDPALLDYGETTQYVFVPVDQKILADRPVCDVIADAFGAASSDSAKTVWLGLRHFDFSQQKHFLFQRNAHLYASVWLYKDSTRPAGELIYDCTISRWMKGFKSKERFQILFEDFLHQLDGDLSQNMNRSIHYRPCSESNPWMQLFADGDFVLLPHGWMIDGSLDFIYPEAQNTFIRSPGMLRYRSEKRFESIEWGMACDRASKRIDPNWTFRGDSQLFWGLNRWKDSKTIQHELWDVLIVDYSLGAGVHFQPKIGRGPVFGFGVQVSVNYVYSLDVRFQAGVFIQIGMQL